MITKYDLEPWILSALRAFGGSASIPRICEWIWTNHQSDLRNGGDLFYTWQYDIRWSAHRLRRDGRLRAASVLPQGAWQIRT